MVSALARADSFQQTRPLFEQTLEVALSIDPDAGVVNQHAEALTDLISVLTEASSFQQTRPLFEKMLDAARSIDSSPDRAEALCEVASALAEVSAFNKALDVARSIDNDSDRAEALSKVAPALAQADSCKQAINAARSINLDFDRAEALCEVAPALAETGQSERAENALKQALDTARSIDDDVFRNRALRDLACALADVGSFEQALDTTRSIDREAKRAEALSGMASALAGTGSFQQTQPLFEQILEAARSIDPGGVINYRAETLSGIAQTLTHAGNLDFAVEVSLSITDFFERASAVKEIARHQAKDGRQTKAFAEHLPAVELAHDGWTGLLSTWREALLEHTDEPRSLLRQSFAPYPFDAESAAEGVYSLVQAHVQAGAVDHAEAIARECPELELGVLVQEPDLPIPEGCDPENLTGFFEQQFEDLVESYEHGDLDDAAFKENAENIFKAADPE